VADKGVIILGDWVTTIISSIGDMFSALYHVNNADGGPTLAINPILACVLLPVVSGIAAFAVRLIKRRKA
jgi:hypothetical protein